MKRLYIRHIHETGNETAGFFVFLDDDMTPLIHGVTLELPWINNQRNISRIPSGIYLITPEIQEERGKVFRILHVPGREGVLIHVLNYFTQTNGCIGLGERFTDINNDGEKDITNSRATVDAVWDAANNEMCFLEIV